MSPTSFPPNPQTLTPPTAPVTDSPNVITGADKWKEWAPYLSELVKRKVRNRVDPEKIHHYAVCRRNDFYYHGHQSLRPKRSRDNRSIIDYEVIDSTVTLRSGTKLRVYNYVLNDFRGDLRKWVGILGHRTPNVKCRPKWPTDETGRSLSVQADDVAGFLRSEWKVDSQMPHLVLSLGKNGTTFIHTPWVADAVNLGYYEVPVWSQREEKLDPDLWKCFICGWEAEIIDPMEPPPPACPQCGNPMGPENKMESPPVVVPFVERVDKFPHGRVDFQLWSSLNVTTPFYIKGLQRCPWLWLAVEEESAKLVDMFPDAGLDAKLDAPQARGWDDSSSVADVGRTVREQMSSPTQRSGYTDADLWSFDRFWIDPSYYRYLPKLYPADSMVGQTMTEWKTSYPRGMKLSFVLGDLVARPEHEAITDTWVEVMPEMSEFLWADPTFNDYVRGADLMNNAWNIIVQTRETAIPAVAYNPDKIHPEKVREGWEVNEWIPVDGPVSDADFAKLPQSDVNAQDFAFIDKVREVLREIVGLLPSAYGGEGPVQTAEQARRQLNQALLVLSTTWNGMRIGVAKAFQNAILQIARYSNGQLASSMGTPESLTVREMADIRELLKGGWTVEADQAIPVGWTQLRDFIIDLAHQAPEVALAMGANDPDNLMLVQEGQGVPGWKIPGVKEKESLLGVIRELLQGEPMESIDPMTGAPTSQPSIPFDDFIYDPQFTVTVVKEWFLGEEARSLRDTPGWRNVLSFGLEARQALQPPLLPDGSPAPPMGGGASPPPGSPPSSSASKTPEAGDNPPQLPSNGPLFAPQSGGMVQ